MIFTIFGFVKKLQKISAAEKWKIRIRKTSKVHFLFKKFFVKINL